MIALVVTTVISALVPAIGAFYGFGISIADYPVFNPGAFESALHDIPRVRDGSLRVLDLGAITGIVTFPSFHAASAALYLWALWPVKWLRPVTLFANIAMLAATPLVGGHYFIDIFAGIAVAVVSILAAGKVCRHVLAGSPVRGTAMPQAASSG
jgi:membrane-associated phospholipid phosphatase